MKGNYLVYSGESIDVNRCVKTKRRDVERSRVELANGVGKSGYDEWTHCEWLKGSKVGDSRVTLVMYRALGRCTTWGDGWWALGVDEKKLNRLVDLTRRYKRRSHSSHPCTPDTASRGPSHRRPPTPPPCDSLHVTANGNNVAHSCMWLHVLYGLVLPRRATWNAVVYSRFTPVTHSPCLGKHRSCQHRIGRFLRSKRGSSSKRSPVFQAEHWTRFPKLWLSRYRSFSSPMIFEKYRQLVPCARQLTAVGGIRLPLINGR